MNDSFSNQLQVNNLIGSRGKHQDEYTTNNSVVMNESADGQPKTLWPSSSGGKYKFDPNNEEMMNLKLKYDDLKEQFQKDKEFYERALETRTEQLEAKEAENEKLA